MTDQPIACTLTLAGVRDRISLMERLASDALLAREPIGGGLRLRFRDDPGIEQHVRELAAAESECCAFLRFDVHPDSPTVVLDITGSQDAQPAITELFAALRV